MQRKRNGNATGKAVHGDGQVCGLSFNRLSSLLVTVDNGAASTLALWDASEERLIQQVVLNCFVFFFWCLLFVSIRLIRQVG